MSDIAEPHTFAELLEWFRPHQPPAPRISEEEIQRVVNELCEASDDYWREKFAAILRTLNESRKA